MNNNEILISSHNAEQPSIHGSVSVDAIAKFLNACKQNSVDMHAFQLYQNNELKIRVSVPPYDCTSKRQVYSLSKSFTSSAIGFAVADKLLTVDDRVIDFFPHKLPGTVSENLAAMQVRHLLSMNTGHEICTMPEFKDSEDGVKGFLAMAVEHKPGSHFAYNTGASYMLSAIITKVTGLSLYDYLHIKLFAPLGIDNAFWGKCAGEVSEGGFGLHISCDDAAKLGLLYLNEGSWEGKQLLPKEWVREASASHSDNSGNGNVDWTSGYGYQFWMSSWEGYRGDGAFGQLCMIIPERNMVFTAVAQAMDMQREVDLVYDFIRSAFDETTFEKPDLDSLLSNYYPALSSETASFDQAGTIYKCNANPMGITLISLNIRDEKLVFQFSDGIRIQNIICGNGEWIENHIEAKNMKPTLIGLVPNNRLEKLRFAASYHIRHGSVEMFWRYLDTPHKEKVVCRFEDDQISTQFEAQENTLHPNAMKLLGTAWGK